MTRPGALIQLLPRLMASCCALVGIAPSVVVGADAAIATPAETKVARDGREFDGAANADADVALSDGDVVEGDVAGRDGASAQSAQPNVGAAQQVAAKSQDRNSGSGLTWGRAPIAWRGGLTATYDMSTSSGAPTARTFGKSASFSGDSYIYAPWLARVTGGFSLSQTSIVSESRSEASGYGFDLGLNLFPVSRFPFSANVNRSASGDFVFSRYTLSQSYLPKSEDFSTSAQYERSVFESSGLTNVIHRFSGNYRQTMRTDYPQTLLGTWNIGLNRPTTNAARLSSYDFRVEHSANLYDDYGLTLSNNASYVSVTNHGDPTTGGGRVGGRFVYLASGNSWEPFIDLPLVIHSAITHSSSSLTTEGSTTLLDTTSGEVRTAYSFGSYLSLAMTGRFDYVRTNEGARTSTAFSLIAQSGYGVGSITQFDVLGFKYQLGYNANAGFIGNADGDVEPTVGGALTQSLSRDFDVGLGAIAPLSFLLSQSYGTSWTRGGISAKTVATTLSLNWQYSQARYGFSSRLEVQDGRTIDSDNPAHFQSIRWDNQGRLMISPVSSLNASLSMGWSRQAVRSALGGDEDLRFAPWVGSGNGTVNYQNVRFLDVPRLTYSAAYAINFQPGLLARGNRGGGHYQNFSQRLSYMIGKLRLGADHTVASFGGGVAQSLNLTVTRELSGVL